MVDIDVKIEGGEEAWTNIVDDSVKDDKRGEKVK